MEKSEVLKIIDEVMNNREVDSIRNAILAIRDKVIEAPETDKQIIKAVWEKNENGQYLKRQIFSRQNEARKDQMQAHKHR